MKWKWFAAGALRSFWLMCSTSFTCVMLFMAMFQPLGWEGNMTPAAAWQLFAMCATISAVMLLWDLPERGLERLGVPEGLMLVLTPLLRCAVVCLIVLTEGAAFGFFPLSWQSVLGLLPVVAPVFFITYAVYMFNYHRAKKDAEEINEKIQRKKRS